MGADFIPRAHRTINVSWDNHRLALGTPDLFTRQLACPTYVEPARVRRDVELTKGEQVTVEVRNEGLQAVRGMTIVADFISPPSSLIEEITAMGGVVGGTVEEVLDGPMIAEIEICK